MRLCEKRPDPDRNWLAKSSRGDNTLLGTHFIRGLIPMDITKDIQPMTFSATILQR
jgi:hypothetical protein